MAEKKVTDPETLKRLKSAGGKAAKRVDDPELVAKLNAGRGDLVVDDDDLDGMDLVSEGMSGVNEGLADLASLPSQILEGALSIGPFIANNLGRPTPYPDYVPDLGEPARDLMESVGAIRPPIDQPAARIVRRVGP